jgi:hypothetical protein
LDKWLWPGIGLCAAAGMALVWFSTPTGPIFSPDSVSYIRSLRLLQAGAGVLSLDNHWPPGYPLLLSFMYSLVGSEMLAGRLLSAISLALSLVAVALFISRLDNLRIKGILLPLVVLLHLLGYGFSYLFLFALSEPPFVAALCWALVGYQRTCAAPSDRGSWLLLSCCLAAMLLLRYTALPLFAAFLFSLAVQLYLSDWRRLPVLLAVVLGVGLLSSAPLITWLWLISGETGEAVREFSFHALRMVHFRELTLALSRWMGGIEGTLAFCIYMAVLVTAAWQWLKNRRPELLLLLTCSVGYLLFLILSLTFFDAHTPLNARLVLPLYPLFFLLLVSFAASFTRSWRGLDYSAVLATLLVLIIGLGLPALRLHLKTSAAGAIGSANLVERNLELYRRVAALPPETPVYSNTGEILYLFFKRDVLAMPRLYDPLTMQQNTNFIAETAAMVEHMYVADGMLLWMPVGGKRNYYPKSDVLLHFPLKIIAEADGGYLMVPAIAE